jgi:chorismate synthase
MGCVIDGCPAGLKLSPGHIKRELDRDMPYKVLTRRVEENIFQILSGVFEGYTIGTPISIIVRNGNVESEKYRKIMYTPRPGHADLTYRLKYGHVDWRGGSRASGRTWISVIAAGGVAKRVCARKKIKITSRMLELGGKKVTKDNLEDLIDELGEESRTGDDASGGVIEVKIDNPPTGLGAPAFNRFHADLGHAILNIPGIKSFDLGRSKDAARKTASQFNDPLVYKDGKVTSITNKGGGVLGGITYGPPVVFKFTVKPTPSIRVPQKTVDLRTMRTADIVTQGRFDVNFTPRVQVVAEAVSAIITADHLLLSGYVSHDSVIPRKERLRYDVKK